MDFFDKFCDPNTIHTLTLSEKMISSLIVTVLGMGVTFVGLVSIMLMTWISSAVVRKIESNINKPVSISNKPAVNPQPVVASEAVAANGQEVSLDSDEITEELVAVITAAVAAALGTQTSSIVISNIRRVSSNSPTWAMMGLTEQVNSRF